MSVDEIVSIHEAVTNEVRRFNDPAAAKRVEQAKLVDARGRPIAASEAPAIAVAGPRVIVTTNNLPRPPAMPRERR